LPIVSIQLLFICHAQRDFAASAYGVRRSDGYVPFVAASDIGITGLGAL
jgi:hypothetical protein